MSGTDLYRFYDIDGQLLYVGISLHAAMRASQHKGDKDWWPDVVNMAVEHLEVERAEAHTIERQAIIDEKPLHNITHNQPHRGVPDGDDGVIEFDASMIVDMYDVEAVTAYNNLAAAMDAIAKLCDQRARDGAHIGTRADFLHVFDGLSRSLVYGDCCDKCGEIRSPFILRRESERWARCGYLCPGCGAQWSCGWTTDLAILAVI
jgi:hypothetical protein